MNKELSLRELKDKDIRRIKNRPAIGGFKDDLSLGFILESAYISPKFYSRRKEDINNRKGFKILLRKVDIRALIVSVYLSIVWTIYLFLNITENKMKRIYNWNWQWI